VVNLCEEIGVFSSPEFNIGIGFFGNKRVTEIAEDPIAEFVSVAEFLVS
jgi:hypothetical protein